MTCLFSKLRFGRARHVTISFFANTKTAKNNITMFVERDETSEKYEKLRLRFFLEDHSEL